MARYAIVVNFFIEADGDPDDLALSFAEGLGGPVLEAANRWPEGEVLGADVDKIREPYADEVAFYFEE